MEKALSYQRNALRLPLITRLLVVFTFALLPPLLVSGADSSIWVVTISLDSPDIVPPAIQWTILNQDPLPKFDATVQRMRGYIKKRLENAGSEPRVRQERAAQMSVYWNGAFKEVTGDHVHLLTPGFHSITSDGEDGPKWIVTKTVSVHGEPVCWCIPIETAKGATVDVKFTAKNRFDLLEAYERALNNAPSPK